MSAFVGIALRDAGQPEGTSCEWQREWPSLSRRNAAVIERRAANSLAKLVAMLVGIFTLIGTLVGAGVTVGQHLRADSDQDRRLSALEEQIRVLDTIAVSEHPRYSSTIYPEGP